jgi:hypothetical protein
MIINILSQEARVLAKDLNGNHVIQKCLQKMGSQDNQVTNY